MKGMKIVLVLTGLAAILLGLAGGFFGRDAADDSPDSVLRGGSRPLLTQDIARGFRLRSGDPDSPIISFGSVRRVKRKVGPFALGAFNVLEVEDFKIVFSSVGMNTEGQSEKTYMDEVFLNGTLSSATGATGLKRILNIRDGISGLLIRRLSVAVEAEGETEYILRADRAEAKSSKELKLTGCRFMDVQKRCHAASKGVLRLETPVALTAAGHQVILREVIDACF